MRKIRFLILTAVFALVGFSIVSCPGASPSGTAKVSEAAAALGAGIPLNTPFDTAALHSDIAITLANVSTVDSWNTPADAITWLKWKASADAETQDMTADTIGGVTVTAAPTGEGKDCISVNIKSTAGAQKEFDGILTEIVIPADKLTSNAELAVKLGIGDNANGVPLKFVNSGIRVAGTPVVAFASGSMNAEGGRALYSIASDFSEAFVSEVNAATATGGVKVTNWFSGLNGKNIEAFATRIATQDKESQGNDDPEEIAKRTIEIVFKSGATALTPTDRLIKSDLVIENPSTGTKYLPDGVGKVTIADAVKMYVRKLADGDDGVKATVAITKPADAKTIEGATRTALDAELKVTIDGDCVAFDIKKDDDGIEAGLARLINLPLGVKASLKEDISAGDTSFVIALSGKPSDITQAAVDEAVEAHNPWVTDDVGSARALLTSAITGYVPGANPYEPEDDQYMPMLTGKYNTATGGWTKGLLAVDNPVGDNQLKWAITETPYAVIQNATEDSPKAIRGIVGQPLQNVDVTIAITGGNFVAFTDGEEGNKDVSGWFNLPQGLSATATVQNAGPSVVVTISGAPSATLDRKAMVITIPASMWSGSSNLVVDANEFAYCEAKAAYATVSDATINGKINTAIANQTVTLTLTNAKFVAFTNDNKTVTPWFKNLPADLVATATTQDAAQSVVVTISGTPRTVSNAPLEIKIPANMMTNLAETPAALESDVTVDANANCKFAISPRATVSTATISGTQNAALAANQTVTITLDGAKFVAFKDQNKDVSGWFTNRPQGLSATAAVQPAGTSVVVTISGTPTAASNAPLEIVIPKEMMTNLATEPVTLTSDITVDANANCKFSIAAAAQQP